MTHELHLPPSRRAARVQAIIGKRHPKGLSSMLGAIAGDIIGSVYEWDNIKTKEFTLFDPASFH